jgi:hypothetical protein
MERSVREGGVVARDEWISETSGTTWLGRLVSPGSSRPGTVPFLALGAAVVAYVLSLALDWVGATGRFKLGQNSNGDRIIVNLYGAQITIDNGHATLVSSGNVTGLDLMGFVYGLGGLALVALGFAVLTRSELALRLRMVAAGLGIGVLGVVIAAAVKLPIFLVVNGSAAAGGSLESLDRSFKPGIFCAAAAAVLPVLAVWIRSAPAARTAIEAEEAARQAPAAPVPVPSPEAPSRLTTAPDASVVFGQYDPDPSRWRRAPSAPFDLSVKPDD